MARSRTQSLEAWIHETLTDPDKDGPCRALALVHMINGNAESEVHSRKMPDKISAEDIEAIAQMFWHKAESYAEGISGAQTFCLQAFHGAASRPTAKHPFVVAGYTEIDGLMTEGPSGKGFMQQMMRHNEGIIRCGQQKDAHLFDSLLKTLDLQQKENIALRRENIEGFGFIKELILQLSDRQHEHRMAEIAAQNGNALKQQLIKYAPSLLNTLTGRELIPQNAADTNFVDGLIDWAIQQGEKALPLVASMNLPPELLTTFASRFKQAVELRNKEALARRETRSIDSDGLQ